MASFRFPYAFANTIRDLAQLSQSIGANFRKAELKFDSVDQDIADVAAGTVVLCDGTPLMDGIADAGISEEASRCDHVHPTDTTRAAVTDLTSETTARIAGDADRVYQSDVFLAMDLAQDAQTEATNLADELDRRIDFELDEKADRIDIGILMSIIATDEALLTAHEAETGATAHGGFYNRSSSDALFVNVSGDTMTGSLAIVDGGAGTAVVIAADSIQWGLGVNAEVSDWDISSWDVDVWGGAAVSSLDVGFERTSTGVLAITAGDTLDLTPGTARVDTQVPGDVSTKAASTEFVSLAVGGTGLLASDYQADIFMAQDLAQDARIEATNLADEIDRRIDFELDEKADRMETVALRGAVDVGSAALATHIANPTGAHASSAVSNTPAGNIAATDVQSALNELDTEKATTGSVTTVQANVDAETATRGAADTTLQTNLTAGDLALSNRIDPIQSDVFLAMDLAQDAIAEATNLDSDMDRKVEFELDEKADRIDLTLVKAEAEGHIAQASGAHTASAVSVLDVGNYYVSTNVETVLQEVAVNVTANTIAAKYRGQWSASTQYATGDIVIFDGNSIIATSTPTLGVTPVGNALAGNWDYSIWDGTVWGSANGWTFLVARGAAGAAGSGIIDEVARSEAWLAQDLAQDAQAEATNLDSDMDRKVEFELDEKADRIHRHDELYLSGAIASETRLGTSQTTAITTATDVQSLTVTGDGTNSIIVNVSCSMSASLVGGMSGGVWTGANKTGTQIAEFFTGVFINGGNITISFESIVIAPFTGTQTYYFNIVSQAGTATLYGDNSTVIGSILRARWIRTR